MNQFLLNNYENTHYRFTIKSKDISIKIGQINSVIDKILEQNNWKNYSIISAFNPKSIKISIRNNISQHKKLLYTIRNDTFFEGWNRAEDSNWDERSVIIFDISLKRSKEIAISFNQLAIVRKNYTEKARIVLI